MSFISSGRIIASTSLQEMVIVSGVSKMEKVKTEENDLDEDCE